MINSYNQMFDLKYAHIKRIQEEARLNLSGQQVVPPYTNSKNLIIVTTSFHVKNKTLFNYLSLFH